MKKSQIQEIKEGRAMRERVWSGRLQPYGPRVQLDNDNAVRLTTVPSSSEEKFKGGRAEPDSAGSQESTSDSAQTAK